MEESTSKEKVLKAVREALISKTDQPFPRLDIDRPVFREMEEPADINFAQELTSAGGVFVYCETEKEVHDGLKYLISEKKWEPVFAFEPWVVELLNRGGIPVRFDQDQVTSAVAGITGCEFLLARLGSVVVSTGQMAGRRIFIFPEYHVVIAKTSQLVTDIRDALQRIRKKYESRTPSMISVITGPSRTADIEKTLVMGAHGPRELYVFMLEDRV